MNKQYIAKQDAKGRDIYYAVEDGKMKKVSRSEYMAHTEPDADQTSFSEIETRQPETSASVSVETVREKALAVVKGIIESTGRRADKVRLQIAKRCVLVNYRNCMVCSLVFDDERTVAAIRFMGTTLDTRKQATVCEPADLRTYSDKIAEQVDFIDRWYAMPKAV